MGRPWGGHGDADRGGGADGTRRVLRRGHPLRQHSSLHIQSTHILARSPPQGMAKHIQGGREWAHPSTLRAVIQRYLRLTCPNDRPLLPGLARLVCRHDTLVASMAGESNKQSHSTKTKNPRWPTSSDPIPYHRCPRDASVHPILAHPAPSHPAPPCPTPHDTTRWCDTPHHAMPRIATQCIAMTQHDPTLHAMPQHCTPCHGTARH